MADDQDKSVQTDTASPESGTVSPDTGTQSQDTGTQTQPSVEEQIAKAMGEQTEIITRKIQSAGDKAVARITREADSTAKMTEDAIAALDATTGEESEGAKPKRQDQYRSQLDARRQQEAAVKKTVDTFESNIRQHITDLGIDPDDKGIEWGDSGDLNLVERQGKILTSVGKIQKENAKLAEGKAEQKFKDLEVGLRKDLGLDTVDTTTSAGVASGSDANFMGKFGSGDLPVTKANEERYNKIKSQYK